MAHLYFVEHLTADEFTTDAVIEVTGDEARHAVRVSRLRVGEQILIGDGCGTLAGCVVVETEKERFRVRVRTIRHDPEPAQRLVLVQALAKGDRNERAAAQATEFGVDTLLPWQAERSVSRWAEHPQKAQKGVEKWSRIVREAAKQSLRSRIPEVGLPVDLSTLRTIARASQMLVLHPQGTDTLSELAGSLTNTEDVYLVVGPEGGFSAQELQAFADEGATIVRLGSTVLRTSSAGPAALAVINAAIGRW